MTVSKVAKRYAQAVFKVAKEQNVIESLAEDFQGLSVLIRQSDDFNLFIRNPIIKKDDRAGLITRVFSVQLHPLALKFLLFLIDKNRLNLVGEILLAFEMLHKIDRNVLDVQLTSERVMDQAQLDVLIDQLKEQTKQTIQVATRIDPDLIGGFKLQINDVVYDASLKTQLLKFQESITSTV